MNTLIITEKQKKIFIMTGIFALALAVFIMFVYMPADKHLTQLKSDYLKMEEETKQLKRYVGEGNSLEEVIIALNKKMDIFTKKFPEKEEAVLRDLPALAASLGIEIVTMRPEKKRVIQGPEGSSFNIKGVVIQEMPISLSLRTSYKVLGEFFRVLRSDFPIFVKVESVQMMKSDKDANILNVTVNLNTYLVIPNKA